MMNYILALLSGLFLPLQTSVNTRLAKKSGSSFHAVLFCFAEALLVLFVLLLINEKSVLLSYCKYAGQPWWFFTGGACGVIFITAVTFLNGKLGTVQSVVLPVSGQIFMSLAIDETGLFNSTRYPLSLTRILGAALVFAGVIIIALSKKDGGSKKSRGIDLKTLLLSLMGILAGMFSASQTAINTYAGAVMQSGLKATAMSFETGFVLLCLISIAVFFAGRGKAREKVRGTWWMWTGGFLGLAYVYASIYFASVLGTASAVLALLAGSTAGGILIDHFGLFGCNVQKINLLKAIGIACLMGGVFLVQAF